MQFTTPKEYLEILQRENRTPNFWMSEEYIEKAGLVFCVDRNAYGYKDDVHPRINPIWFLPPIQDNTVAVHLPTFAGLPDVCSCSKTNPNFLDYQFIYNPMEFLNMNGGKWKVFRKNVRKYPATYRELEYLLIEDDKYDFDLGELAYQFGQRKVCIQDSETFVKFLLHGKNRKGLFYQGHLVGVNVWDENYKYINYRYCIDDGTPYLQEFLRWLFYTDPIIYGNGKLVNDGGSLGEEGLEKFKWKLNPYQVFKIHTAEKQGE